MKTKKAIAVLLIILCATFLVGCTRVVYVEVTPAPTSTATPMLAPSPTPSPSPSPTAQSVTENKSSIDMTPGLILDTLKDRFEDTEDLQYDATYSEDSNMFTIYIYMKKAVAIAALAIEGDAYGIEAWDSMTTSLTELNTSTTNLVRALGSDALVSIVLQSSAEAEIPMIYMTDSVVTFDMTK